MIDEKYEELFSGNLEICYSQFYIEPEDPEDEESMEEQFRGQVNGLCGATVPERLFFTARPKDAVISIDVLLYKGCPPLSSNYSDIVEVSFKRGKEPVYLCQWAHEEEFLLNLAPGNYRVRYCIEGLDKDYDYDVEDDDYFEMPVPGQKYLIQIWPQNLEQDKIVKQGSEESAYWHNTHGVKCV
jgi:hypothetical protein